LFGTKTIYEFLLALVVGIAELVFPFLPRHLTLVGTLTIGMPAFFLSLAPNAARARPGFTERVFRFAVPAGALAFAATFAAYLLVGGPLNGTLEEAQTTATMVLFLVGLWTLVILSRPITARRVVLVATMAAIFAIVMMVPSLRSFFALGPLPFAMLAATASVASAAGLGLELVARLIDRAHPATHWLGRQILALLDPEQATARALTVLGALVAGALLVVFGVLQDVISGDPIVRADAAVFHLLQSLRTPPRDRLIVAITELGDGIVTTAVAAAAFMWFAWHRAWRVAVYCVAAAAAAGLFAEVLKVILHIARPIDIYSGWDAFSFPSGHAAVNAALYGFLALLIAREVKHSRRLWVGGIAALFVFSIAFSRLYLGAHWLSDVIAGLSFSTAWVALLGIAYLHHEPLAIDVRRFSCLIALTILAVGGFHIVRDHASDTARYTVRTEIRTMTLADWWKEGWAELPARRVDLTGEFEEPFTVQWVGDLDRLKSELMPHQWRVPVAWSRRSGFAWLNPHADVADLPVTPRLETGQREVLTLVQLGNLPTTRTVLRVWRSDLNLADGRGAVQPLWIATVMEERVETLGGFMTVTRTESEINSPRDRVAASLGIWRSAQRVGETNLPSWDGSVLLAYDARLSLPTSK